MNPFYTDPLLQKRALDMAPDAARNAVIGWGAGIPGFGMDMMELAQMLGGVKMGVTDPGFISTEQDLPGTSNDIGRRLGGDPSSAAFQVGGVFSPGPGELVTALKALPALMAAKRVTRMPGKDFDPRFDPRKREQERLANLQVDVEAVPDEAPEISIFDLEGRPFVSSMSDRTAAGGRILGINGLELDRPVDLLGGQDFMIDNDKVWASAKKPSSDILKLGRILAEQTGLPPVYVPWRMAPTGGDFAHMTGETMLNYAAKGMNVKDTRKADSMIKDLIPGWSGIRNPKSIDQYRAAPDRVRKQVKKMLDVNFRDDGGLSIGEARLSVTDPKQYTGADTGLMNVGEINTNADLVTNSGHTSYPYGVPGRGLGRLKEDIMAYELMPEAVKFRGIQDPRMPAATDIRALQMKPYGGIINENLLRTLADRPGGI